MRLHIHKVKFNRSRIGVTISIVEMISKICRLGPITELYPMKLRPAIVVLVLSTLFNLSYATHRVDSLRIETKNGKSYVVHRVDPKETLFGIAKRYQSTITDIENENPQVRNGLKIGQEISIPVIVAGSNNSVNEINHLVDVGETLYAISRKYGVTVEQLKSWNELTSNELSVGQNLVVMVEDITAETPIQTLVPETETSLDKSEISTFHIVTEKETLYSISRQYNISVYDLKTWNDLSDNNLSIGQRLLLKGDSSVTTAGLKEPVQEQEGTSHVRETLDSAETELTPVIDASTVTEFNSRVVTEGALQKVLEEGMAQVIENSTDTKKYLALHRSADVGTVMRVKNLMNNLIIYVRVVGKLPGTGPNDNLLLKISRTAFERLGGIDQQFPVEVSYIP